MTIEELNRLNKLQSEYKMDMSNNQSVAMYCYIGAIVCSVTSYYYEFLELGKQKYFVNFSYYEKQLNWYFNYYLEYGRI